MFAYKTNSPSRHPSAMAGTYHSEFTFELRSLVDLLQVVFWQEYHPSTAHSSLTDERSYLKGVGRGGSVSNN